MTNSPETSDIPVKKIDRFISRMPSLSTTVTRVLEICNNPATSPTVPNRVISLDPVLTGQVLKLINSAYYALRNKVTSLTRAIIMLGMNTIKNLVVSAAVLNSVGKRESFMALSMEDFWLHSVCVGVTAKSLAIIGDVPATDHEEFFVAGLLHDLGKIPLNTLFPDKYKEVVSRVTEGNGPLYQMEMDVLGIDHMRVGSMIADKWQLSDSLNRVLAHHHRADIEDDENRMIIQTVSLANTLSKLFKIGSAGDPVSDNDTIARLIEANNFSPSELSGLRENVFKEIEKAQIFLQFTIKG